VNTNVGVTLHFVEFVPRRLVALVFLLRPGLEQITVLGGDVDTGH